MLPAAVRIEDYLLLVDAACGGEDLGFGIQDSGFGISCLQSMLPAGLKNLFLIAVPFKKL